MRITINIETGDLGMKAGLARTTREGNVFNVLVDTSRLSHPRDTWFVIAHEFGHAMAELQEEERQAKNEAFTKAVNHIVDDTLGGKRRMIRAIEVTPGMSIEVPGDGVHYVTGVQVRDRYNGLLDGDVLIKWAGGEMIFQHDTKVRKVSRG